MPSLSVLQQLRLLGEWAPLLSYGQRWISETDAHKRLLIVGDAGEWLASKSATKLDDQLIDHLVAVAKTAEGEALIRFIVAVGVPAVAAAESQV
jgi:hypothetical protein